MARYKRKTKRERQGTSSSKDVKPTEEELHQERSFFMWTAIITVLIVIGLYFLLF